MQDSGNFGQPYQPPIPSPLGDPNQNNPIPPIGPAQVNFDVISRAWELLKPTLGTWVIAFLIYLAVTFGISLIWKLLTGGATQTVAFPSANGTQSIPVPNIPLMIVGNLIQLVISQFLMGGLYRMAVNQVRGIAPSIGGMFSVTDVLPALLGAAVLTSIAIFFGFLFCVIPGLLLAGLFLFTTPLIVDRKLGPIEAMTTSLNALKPQMWMALAFAIVIGLMAGAGALACGVGIFVTWPLAILSVAILYRDFFPQPTLS